MDKEQIVNDLKESMEDVFESIEKVRGEKFCQAVKYLHLSMHTYRLIKLMLDERIPPKTEEMLAMQYSQLVEFGFSALADGFSEDEQKEIWRWAEQVDNRMATAMKELNK